MCHIWHIPKNPAMAVRFSTIHRRIYCAERSICPTLTTKLVVTLITHLDDKIVQRCSGVQTINSLFCVAVLRSHQTRLIFAPGAKRPSPPLPTDAKPRAEAACRLCRGAKEEKPPLDGLKGDLGGMSIFFLSFSISGLCSDLGCYRR